AGRRSGAWPAYADLLGGGREAATPVSTRRAGNPRASRRLLPVPLTTAAELPLGVHHRDTQHGAHRVARELSLQPADDRMAQASERVSRSGARQDLVRHGAIRAARDREALVAVERMVVERAIDEPEARRLVDHGDDPRRVERPEAEVVREHADGRADPDRGTVRHDLEPADAERLPATDGLA